jgi:hypothetical protein
MVDAAQRELAAIGVDQVPEVLLADAGYWHQDQMETIVDRGIQVLIPPDAGKRKGNRPGWKRGRRPPRPKPRPYATASMGSESSASVGESGVVRRPWASARGARPGRPRAVRRGSPTRR